MENRNLILLLVEKSANAFYSKQLVISLPVSTRFLKFSLNDLKTGPKLTFAPNLEYNLGLSKKTVIKNLL